eukprot:scaffold2447_cov110-Cylindrotheca_fusiformis.AAC.2
MASKSPSIPIQQSWEDKLEDFEVERDRVLADYRDYLFCDRVVRGMKRRQEQQHHSCSPNHKYQTRALIRDIIETRNAALANEKKGIGLPVSFSTRSNLCDLDSSSSIIAHQQRDMQSYITAALAVAGDDFDYENDMMFELDM